MNKFKIDENELTIIVYKDVSHHNPYNKIKRLIYNKHIKS